ncbi:MAG: hypothetical protein WBM00_09910 [Solirubrobacterales bacterium]
MRRGARRRWGRSLGWALGLACLVSLLAAAPAGAAFDCGAYIERCQVQIDNSGDVWFGSVEKLTEDALGDGTLRHGVFQVYERSGETTTLVSRMPDGSPIPVENIQNVSAGLLGVSPDGSRVYLGTEASLTSEDGDAGHEDGSWDYYELSNGKYTLLTTGPLDGPFPIPNATAGSHRLWASDDGKYVYFETAQRLTAEDTDEVPDIYERSGGQTRLVSTGPSAVPFDPNLNRPAPIADFLGASTDGATAYFATIEQLTPDDAEPMTSDIYSWHDGVTTRVTHTVNHGEGPGTAYEIFDQLSFGGAATDGSLFYVAFSPQTPDDTNQYEDLYAARPGGITERLTTAPPDPALESDHGFLPGSKRFLRPGAASQDGSRVFFITTRKLVPEDTDETLDIYMWSAGQLRLVSVGTVGSPGNTEELHLDAISRDGRRAYFETYEQLTPEDTDNEVDVYEWDNGTIRLVSPASDGHQTYAFFEGISPNGRYVAFSTLEDLVPGDNDARKDIYVIDMGTGQTAAASISRVKPGARHRRRRRLRLVTAESIPPRIAIAAGGTFKNQTATVRLGCPKAERSGPCHGRVRLLDMGTRAVIAGGSFRIPTGHRHEVVLNGRGLARHGGAVLARVRGVDRLGNAAVVERKVHLRAH